jgi:hypothetical protein
MTMYIFASPATLTEPDEKKTGPSRFTPLFQRQRDAGPNYLVLVGRALPRRHNFTPDLVIMLASGWCAGANYDRLHTTIQIVQLNLDMISVMNRNICQINGFHVF